MGESELAGRVDEALREMSCAFEIGYCLKAGGVIIRCISNEEDAVILGEVIKNASAEDFVAEGLTAIEEGVIDSLALAGESVATA